MFLKLPVLDEWCNVYLIQALSLVRAEPNKPEHILNVFTMSGDQLTILYQKTFPTESEAVAARETLGKAIHVWTGSDELTPDDPDKIDGEDELPDDVTLQ